MIQLRVVKRQMPYIEIRGDPWFLPVCYSDYGVEREDDNEVSIDTQPAAAVVTPVSPEFQDIFLVEATNSPRRKIRRVSPDDYGVYIDEESNAHAMERKIINDSKEDIEAILELLNSLGGCYLSLPQYEGCFQMPRVHPTPSYRHNMLHTS